MDDLVDRLTNRNPCGQTLGQGYSCSADGYVCSICKLRREAAAELARLRAENDALLDKPMCGHRGFAGPTCCVLVKDHAGEHKYGDPEQITIARVIRERDALRADAEQWRAALVGLWKLWSDPKWVRYKADLALLREARDGLTDALAMIASLRARVAALEAENARLLADPTYRSGHIQAFDAALAALNAPAAP